MATKKIAPKVSLDEYLLSRSSERQERYTYEFAPQWPKLTDFETLIYCGAYSWTMPLVQKRLLYESAVLDIGYGTQTPGDVTRDYLDYKYPERLRATAAQRDAVMVHRAFPCLANRVDLDDAAYVDIKSAYWSVILAAGWDVDYYPGRFIGVKSNNEDFPLSWHKGARSGLVTAGLSTPIRVWNGHGLEWKHGNNVHINYGLWALVMDVLHAIASEVERAGGVYVHTDGYIVPASAIDRTMNIITDWGLVASIKERGPAKIYGVGMYSIGKEHTKRVGGFSPGGFRNIYPTEPQWLKSSFTRFSRSRVVAGLTSHPT